jgi:hypothetical protein
VSTAYPDLDSRFEIEDVSGDKEENVEAPTEPA